MFPYLKHSEANFHGRLLYEGQPQRHTQFLTLQAVEKEGVKLPVRSADLLSPVVFGGQGTEGDSSWHGAAPPWYSYSA